MDSSGSVPHALSSYTHPQLDLTFFFCYHCCRNTQHTWLQQIFVLEQGDEKLYRPLNHHEATRCNECDGIAFWHHGEHVYPFPLIPDSPFLPLENAQLLPIQFVHYFNAGSLILARSSATCALLMRLALQVMLRHVHKAGNNLLSDVAELIAEQRLTSDQLVTLQDCLTTQEASLPGQLSDVDRVNANALRNYVIEIVVALAT